MGHYSSIGLSNPRVGTHQKSCESGSLKSLVYYRVLRNLDRISYPHEIIAGNDSGDSDSLPGTGAP